MGEVCVDQPTASRNRQGEVWDGCGRSGTRTAVASTRVCRRNCRTGPAELPANGERSAVRGLSWRWGPMGRHFLTISEKFALMMMRDRVVRVKSMRCHHRGKQIRELDLQERVLYPLSP